MISVKEAEDLILSRSLPTDFTLVDIQEIQGEVLRQPMVADRDYPPLNGSLWESVGTRRPAAPTQCWRRA